MDEGEQERLKDENYRLQQANADLVVGIRKALADLGPVCPLPLFARQTLADALVLAGEGSPLEKASYLARNAVDYEVQS
jgi:hypothetical protein